MPRVYAKKDRTGETRIMNNGMKATIIEYTGKENITVQFENGGIVKNRSYQFFIKGQFKCPMIYNVKGDVVEVINPNNKSIFIIDKEDKEKIEHTFWSKSHGYIKNGRTFLHRFIMNCPKDMIVDHINGDKLDNRKCNLRICTQAQNCCNSKKQKNNTSGYKGVCWHTTRKKWFSSIKYNKKNISLGYFNTPEEAYAAYCKAAKELHGEFARLA